MSTIHIKPDGTTILVKDVLSLTEPKIACNICGEIVSYLDVYSLDLIGKQICGPCYQNGIINAAKLFYEAKRLPGYDNHP